MTNFNIENKFYEIITADRIGKLIAHYELYKSIVNKPGQIVECGVFKGNSLKRWCFFRELLETRYARKVIGFDTFGVFPPSNSVEDSINLEKFLAEAGNSSCTKAELEKQLKEQNLDNLVDLVEGNVMKTIPDYVSKNPELRIALLHLDVDVYEPTKIALEYLFPRMVNNGIVVLDNYGIFHGENKAVEEYFKGNLPEIKKFGMSRTPCYFEVKK